MGREDEDLGRTAEFVVSELATNAITATESAADSGGQVSTGVIGLNAYPLPSSGPAGVVVQVWDCSRREPPQVLCPDEDAEPGAAVGGGAGSRVGIPPALDLRLQGGLRDDHGGVVEQRRIL